MVRALRWRCVPFAVRAAAGHRPIVGLCRPGYPTLSDVRRRRLSRADASLVRPQRSLDADDLAGEPPASANRGVSSVRSGAERSAK
jgi:hypothetical protein